MAVVAFDTHPHIKSLTSAGFSEAQAEAMASLVTSARQADASEAASRADLIAVKSDISVLKSDIAVAKAEVEARIAKSQTSVIMWVAGLVGFQAVAVVGLVRLLLHP